MPTCRTLIVTILLASTARAADSDSKIYYDATTAWAAKYMEPLVRIDRIAAEDTAQAAYATAALRSAVFPLTAAYNLTKHPGKGMDAAAVKEHELALPGLTREAQARFRTFLRRDANSRAAGIELERVLGYTRRVAQAQLAKDQTLLFAVQVALLDATVQVRERFPMLHTEVPALFADASCAGDLVRDRLLWRYFERASSGDYAGAHTALQAIATQLACLSQRQLRGLDGALSAEIELAKKRVSPLALGPYTYQHAKLDLLVDELSAPLLFLVGDLAKQQGATTSVKALADKRKKLSPRVFDATSAVHNLGLHFYDAHRGVLASMSAKCQPPLKGSKRFRGKYGEAHLKFAGPSGETCNGLDAMLGAAALSCPAVDFVPVGISPTLASAFVCDPGCGLDAPPVTKQPTATGTKMPYGPESMACTAPSGGTPGTSNGSSGGRPSVGGVTGQIDSCTAEVLHGKNSWLSQQLACLDQTMPNYRNPGSTEVGFVPTGGPGCGPSVKDGDAGSSCPERRGYTCVGNGENPDSGRSYWVYQNDETKYYSVRDDSGRDSEDFADIINVGQIIVEGSDADGTDGTPPDDEDDSSSPAPSPSPGTDGSTPPADPANAPPAETKTPPSQTEPEPTPEEEAWLKDYWDKFKVGALICSFFDCFTDDPDGCNETPGCVIDDMPDGAYCVSDDPDCGSGCTGTDGAATAYAQCVVEQDEENLTGRSGYPEGQDPRLINLINVRPDAPGGDFGLFGNAPLSCLGGGDVAGLEQCPGQQLMLCTEERPDCGCRPTDRSVAPPPGASCETIQCSPDTTPSLEGGRCTCTSGLGTAPGTAPAPQPGPVVDGACPPAEPNCRGGLGAW